MFEDKPKGRGGQIMAPCPTPEQRLVGLMERSHRSKPKMFPSDLAAAARYWMAHQEPYNATDEKASQMPSGVWETPYHNRVCRTLSIFLGLSDLQQQAVIDNCHIMPWRGDNVPFYLETLGEHRRMLRDPAKYMAELKDKLRAGKKAMQAPPLADDDAQSRKPL